MEWYRLQNNNSDITKCLFSPWTCVWPFFPSRNPTTNQTSLCQPRKRKGTHHHHKPLWIRPRGSYRISFRFYIKGKRKMKCNSIFFFVWKKNAPPRKKIQSKRSSKSYETPTTTTRATTFTTIVLLQRHKQHHPCPRSRRWEDWAATERWVHTLPNWGMGVAIDFFSSILGTRGIFRRRRKKRKQHIFMWSKKTSSYHHHHQKTSPINIQKNLFSTILHFLDWFNARLTNNDDNYICSKETKIDVGFCCFFGTTQSVVS